MDTLVTKLLQFAERHDMLPRGATIVVACSGGADSTALLALLVELARLRDLTLVAVYVNHGLRAEAQREGEQVIALARQLGVSGEVVSVDAHARSRSEGRGLQQGAREARYGALLATAARLGATRIAVGHTADDQAETVLSRLLRGAGTRGLAAIPPVRGSIVRPLLELERDPLHAYVAARRLPVLEDPSNTLRRFERVRLRQALAAEPRNVPRALARVAANLREDESLISELVDELWLQVARVVDGQVELDGNLLRTRPRPLVQRLVLRALEVAELELSRAAVDAVVGLLFDRPLVGTHWLDLVGGRAEQRYGLLRLQSHRRASSGCERCHGAHDSIELELASAPRDVGNLSVAFDADALVGQVVVRGWRPGDRILGRGLGGHRKVAELYIDAKVPRAQRSCRPLLVLCGPLGAEEVLWVPLLRVSAVAPVGTGTTRLLVATLARALP